jgi:uncharacterized protein YndB with AHSA1/START domain
MNTDSIEKKVELKAPISRVWQALTDYHEFGEWFRVKLDGPLISNKISRGYLTYPGYEHYKWEILVKNVVPESLFSFTWHPYALDLKRDYSKEAQTLIEFHLKPISTGTLLLVKESGFDQLPLDRRSEAFRMNEKGWSEQMKNIEAYLSKSG